MMLSIQATLFVLGLGALRLEATTIEERMEQRCKTYAESVYETIEDPILLEGAGPKKKDTCRISSQPTIIGGEKAVPQEFPHMALIGYGERPTHWRCGGSLISELWVLSAAHCTATQTDNLLAKYVLLGDLDVLSTEDDDDDSSRPEILKIVERRNHPGYKRPLVYNDISLYKLNRTVEFSRFIRPICLHAGLSATSKSVVASGWGATMFEGSASSHMLKVGLEVVESTTCNSAFPQSDYTVRQLLRTGINSSSQVCAWAEGKDTCQGDSGGPIQRALKLPYCMYTIIGVTSVGNKCGGSTPSIYTRVSHFLPWIESHVWPKSN